VNGVRDDHGFGIVRRPKKLLNNSHQQVRADFQTHNSCRFVPHQLTVEQAQLQVEFYRKLLQLTKDHRFIKRIITWDEKWIYLNNADLQN
jgi:hypothetical protein